MAKGSNRPRKAPSTPQSRLSRLSLAPQRLKIAGQDVRTQNGEASKPRWRPMGGKVTALLVHPLNAARPPLPCPCCDTHRIVRPSKPLVDGDTPFGALRLGLGATLSGASNLPFPVCAVTACLAVSNIVKSSLGPVGLDKMLVRPAGDRAPPCVSCSPRVGGVQSSLSRFPRFPRLARQHAGRRHRRGDHHQRRRHHPQAARGRAPGRQGPCGAG